MPMSDEEKRGLENAVVHSLKTAKHHVDLVVGFATSRKKHQELLSLSLRIEQAMHNQTIPTHEDDTAWKASGPDGDGYPALTTTQTPETD